ncbi:MAG: site-specific integrase, partial [Lachnospiraceae bacterium]|nr:site-specific integrase [Lachnospiraceae bacterium]
FDLRNKIIPKSDYLFLNDKTRYGKLTYNPLDRHIRLLQKEILKFSNKNIRSCHDCRRTYASIQYLKLGDKCITIIQKQLGHKTPTQTWEYIKDIVEPLNRIDILEAGTIL